MTQPAVALSYESYANYHVANCSCYSDQFRNQLVFLSYTIRTYLCSSLTANEILDLLEEEDEEEDDIADAVDVALFPPAEAADAQSDVDYDASDEPVGLVHHLARRMLAAGPR